MLDLQDMKRLVEQFHTQFKEGRGRRLLIKLKWFSTAQQHRLQRYFARIEIDHTTFSLDLLLLNVCSKLCLRAFNSSYRRFTYNKIVA